MRNKSIIIGVVLVLISILTFTIVIYKAVTFSNAVFNSPSPTPVKTILIVSPEPILPSATPTATTSPIIFLTPTPTTVQQIYLPISPSSILPSHGPDFNPM